MAAGGTGAPVRVAHRAREGVEAADGRVHEHQLLPRSARHVHLRVPRHLEDGLLPRAVGGQPQLVHHQRRGRGHGQEPRVRGAGPGVRRRGRLHAQGLGRGPHQVEPARRRGAHRRRVPGLRAVSADGVGAAGAARDDGGGTVHRHPPVRGAAARRDLCVDDGGIPRVARQAPDHGAGARRLPARLPVAHPHGGHDAAVAGPQARL
mmetsp:Transcript_8603/g.30522  ORF Transcript_8603/g.30522 Transcript_8603/m.30522 type:complete len:206 (+) Transcript_8603:535-1152(+)